MHELDLNFYSFIFSFIAILISLYILYKSRKRLSVHLPEEYFILNEIFTDPQAEPITEYTLASFSFLLVNPSPTDIGFFDLMVLDDKNNPIDYLIKSNVGLSPQDSGLVYSYINNYRCRLYLLDSNFGIFKSNHFTRFEIPVNVTNLDTSSITIRFKITKETLIPNSIDRNRKRKNFKQYSVTIPYPQK